MKYVKIFFKRQNIRKYSNWNWAYFKENFLKRKMILLLLGWEHYRKFEYKIFWVSLIMTILGLSNIYFNFCNFFSKTKNWFAQLDTDQNWSNLRNRIWLVVDLMFWTRIDLGLKFGCAQIRGGGAVGLKSQKFFLFESIYGQSKAVYCI